MSALPNYMFTIFAFVSFFLCLIKFAMHWHAWNVGIHLLQAWVGLSCLAFGINSIIWNHNTVNWAPVWCDISSRFIVAMTVAVPAVVICINRRLYLLASPTSILPSETDKRREIIIDLAIGIGLPIMIMILSFFAQGSRFSIVEDYGCSPAILRTWVAVVIINAPPVLLELIASVYGCLSIHAFYKRRSRLNESLSSHRGLNSNRYLRLMAFSVCDLLAGIPISAFYVYLEFKSPRLFRFPGLTQEHYQFSQIIQVPAVLWRANAKSEVGYELSRWIMVVAAFVSFAIFGFTREARDKYRVVLQAIVHVFTAITGIKTCKRPSNRAEGITFKAAAPNRPVNALNFNQRPCSVVRNT